MKKMLNVMLSGLVVLSLGACGNSTSLDDDTYLEAKNECDAEVDFSSMGYIQNYMNDVASALDNGQYANLHELLDMDNLELEAKSMEYNSSFYSGQPKSTCQVHFEAKIEAGLIEISTYFNEVPDPMDTTTLDTGIKFLQEACDYYYVANNKEVRPTALVYLIDELKEVRENLN